MRNQKRVVAASQHTGIAPDRLYPMLLGGLAKSHWNEFDLAVLCDLLYIYGESGEDIYPEG